MFYINFMKLQLTWKYLRFYISPCLLKHRLKTVITGHWDSIDSYIFISEWRNGGSTIEFNCSLCLWPVCIEFKKFSLFVITQGWSDIDNHLVRRHSLWTAAVLTVIWGHTIKLVCTLKNSVLVQEFQYFDAWRNFTKRSFADRYLSFFNVY